MSDLQVLEARLARMEAVHEIQNLMGRYSFWHSAGMHRECLDLFALTLPDVRAEMMWGVYEGRDALERCYPGFHVWADGDGKGRMHMHALTTPVIQVAEDGQTAKGVWVSPGHETGPDFKDPSVYTANWAWCKYGCDFIKENGVWKIWHLHVYGIMLCPYDRSWVEANDDMRPEDMPPLPDEYRVDRAPTTHWQYGIDRVYVNEPAPPAPHASFNADDAF